jgi:glycosyltransferase involved in cell wall biosynthesis
MLLSVGSFEGFFGWVQGQTRESYLRGYRNDWSWYYAQGLRENFVNAILYIPALREAGKYEAEPGAFVRFLPLERWYGLIEKVWIKRLSRLTRWSLYAEERINTLAFIRSLREALVEDEIDVLYIQEYWSGRFDHLVHRVEVPVVGADHGGLSKGVVKLFKRRAFERANLCYGQTVDECRIVERYGGRARLQPNGCNVAEFFPDPMAKRDRTILTVARLTNRQKRTSDLIRALGGLPAEWSLDIVGTGPDRDMLEKLADELGVADRVRFHGFVGRSQVLEFLRRCGVYAMPSANEAVSLAVLEAMACGTPVVLTRIRAFEKLVTDGVNGRLVSVGDVRGLADGVLDAWERRAAFGRAAVETVRTSYNARVLYRKLAESLRGSAYLRAAAGDAKGN